MADIRIQDKKRSRRWWPWLLLLLIPLLWFGFCRDREDAARMGAAGTRGAPIVSDTTTRAPLHLTGSVGRAPRIDAIGASHTGVPASARPHLDAV